MKSKEELEALAAKEYPDYAVGEIDVMLRLRKAFIAGYKAKEEAGEEDAVDGWISVEDRLPEDEVLFYSSKFGKGINGATYFGWVVKGKWTCISEDGVNNDYENNADYWVVTHWQPLPEKPKEYLKTK